MDNIRDPDSSYKERLIDHDIFSDIEQDEEIKYAIEVSIQESLQESLNNHYEKIEESLIEESINLEIERVNNLEKKKRKDSLDFFKKILKGLLYNENDLNLKKYIEDILNKYINLEIDYIIIDSCIEDYFFKIIDSYFLTPNSNGKKTSITFSEDFIIREIFRKNI